MNEIFWIVHAECYYDVLNILATAFTFAIKIGLSVTNDKSSCELQTGFARGGGEHGEYRLGEQFLVWLWI